MSTTDPLADHVVLEFTADIRCVFIDQPQTPFGEFGDDARDQIAERIFEALAEALPEMTDAGVSFPNRDGGRSAHCRVEGSSLDNGPFDEPLPPWDDK